MRNRAIGGKISFYIYILCVNYVTHGKHNIEMESQQYGWNNIALGCRLDTLNLRPFALNSRVPKYKEQGRLDRAKGKDTPCPNWRRQ